jgi:hypothetical protein
MCIRTGGNYSNSELPANLPGPAPKPVNHELNIGPEGIAVDSLKLKNLANTSPVSSVILNISGAVTGESENPVPKADLKMAGSPHYKTEIALLVTGMHNELKAINKITPKQLKEIQDFDPVKRDMFLTSLRQLESLKAGEINAAGYMIGIMQHAAELSGNDSKMFVTLVGEMFSDIPIPLDPFRRILGAGPHTAGNLLEPMLDRIVEKQGGSFGFNANITDDIDWKNTITHHAGEFLQVGYNRGAFIGKLAGNIIDRNTLIIQDKKNEGDIRSSSFSAMVGAALKDNKIKPLEAVKLFSWAYTTSHGGKYPPPYGADETPGKNLGFKDYKIDNWVNAYNKAFPEAAIP